MKKSIGFMFVHFILVPFIMSLFLTITIESLIGLYKSSGLLLVFIGVALIAFVNAYLHTRRRRKDFTSRYLIVYLYSLYTFLSWTTCVVISEGFYGNAIWSAYAWLTLPFFPFSFIALLSTHFGLFYAPLIYAISFLVGYTVGERKQDNPVQINLKKVSASGVVLLVLFAVGGLVLLERKELVLPSHELAYGAGNSSVDLEPYKVSNPNNKLATLEKPSSFIIEKEQDMPILDGAEATFPVYSAFANAAYRNIGEITKDDDYTGIVSFTNTIYGFERLVKGEVDIFFGAEPSSSQKKTAEMAGKELVLTPIGKEAFVFFVNHQNRVEGLTVQQMKDIYSGKIKNWQDVGGSKRKIRAFQRPENSGSQTIMVKVMGEVPLVEPLKEEMVEGMGGIIEEVAGYRNYKNALGYSFRYYATGMNPNNDIKLLAIDGIAPTTENIQNETYPFTVNLYAITIKDNPLKTIDPFLEWIQGPEGQQLVEETGYIKK